MDDATLRYAIYRWFADTGSAPGPEKLADWTGSAAKAQRSLQRLHDAHSLVLDGDGMIRMALPFSALETGHRVVAGDRFWLANCAWDTLAIPAALEVNVSIEALWLDAGTRVDLSVVDGELSHTDGFIHFAIPARRWWDDIVET